MPLDITERGCRDAAGGVVVSAPHLTLCCGDALAVLKELPDESVHCCVTSSPYFGLRDYGVSAQIGLEPTPAEYVARLVAVFREVRRVLRNDGTLWLNLGDSYANDGKWGGHTGGKHVKALHDSPIGRNKQYTGFKPKDLIGIPWRVAFALQEDGWYLRSDIIWSKPNAMPESVKDRPSRTHEYIFMLSKSARYYYDYVAVREKAVNGDTYAPRGSRGVLGQENAGRRVGTPSQAYAPPGQKPHGNARDKQAETGKRTYEGFNARCPTAHPDGLEWRNRRTVWTIPTCPYAEAHFATFPPALIEPCILAGTSEAGCCACCGRPLERHIEKSAPKHTGETKSGYKKGSSANRLALLRQASREHGSEYTNKINPLVWKMNCKCETTDTKPCVVIDPFIGSGTTALVAARHGRSAIGIELNPAYVAMAKARIEADQPLFNRVEVVSK